MLASFDYETLNKLSPDESLSLTSKLQSLHASLLAMLPSPETVQGIPILRTNIGRLREDTEDLGDLIENLILGSDLNFQKFVSDSVGEVVSK
jgi:hypothetical protein